MEKVLLNVNEAAHRLGLGFPMLIDRDSRKWDAPLNTTVHLDERQLHVNRGRQFRLRQLELTELENLARVSPRRTRRTWSSRS